MFVRGLTLLGGVAGLAVLVAGCGGSGSPSVANITTGSTPAAQTTATGTAPSTPSRAALVACLGDHGLTAVLGSAASSTSTAISLAGVIVTGVTPSSPRFQSAMQACRKYLPGGGPPAMTPAQQGKWKVAMTAFAGCMRKNGVPSFPDPTGEGMFPQGFFSQLDPTSVQFQSALKACRSLEPNFGPRIG